MKKQTEFTYDLFIEVLDVLNQMMELIDIIDICKPIPNDIKEKSLKLLNKVSRELSLAYIEEHQTVQKSNKNYHLEFVVDFFEEISKMANAPSPKALDMVEKLRKICKERKSL